MTCSTRKFRVFEFDEEEEDIVEKESAKFVGKFRIQKRKRNDNKKDDDASSPLTKYNFLQCFGGCTGTVKIERSNEPIDIDDGPIDADTGGEINTLCKGKSDEVVDIDTTVLDDQCQCSVSVPARMPQKDCAVKEEISHLDTLGIDIDDGSIDVATGVVAGETDTLCKGNSDGVVDIDTTIIDDQCQHSVSVPACMPQEDCVDNEISQPDTVRLSSFSNYENELVGMISDNDVSIEMSSSTSVSTPSEDEVPLGNQVLECGSLGHKIDYTNYTVAVFPDYILCGDIYGTESCLTFSGSSIRMEGSTANGVKGKFNAEWNLDDLISIDSEWCEMVTTAMVYLCLRSKVSEGAGNTNDASDVDKLKFSVYDPNWHEGEEAIKSLNVRYKDIWNVTSQSDLEKDGNASFGHNGMFTSKPYFPVIHETFKEVIYPKGDPDAVSISKRDVELLQPETFINDTIIDFYIQYLKNKIQPDDRQRFHFFNSFFFRKLADLDKGPSNACEGRIAFQRVRKWTRKLNVFEKDYIFIPVNYSLHWSLIVICHPGEVVHSREDESGNSRKVPCILHMDSIRGSHKGLKNLIQSYLYEEWRERHNETVDDTLSKFLHLRFVALELPQQENLYDCGLFLLHYVELFLEEAPIDFSPFKITEFSNFLSRNWFIPGEASLKRTHIQKLICEIIEDQSCTQSSDPNEQETLQIQISLTAKSPISVAQRRRLEELGLNSRDLLKPGTSARFLSNGNCWQTGTLHWRTCMSPVEVIVLSQEAEETGERVSDSSLDTEDDQLPAGLAMEFPSTSLSLKDLRSLGSSRNQKYMQLGEPYDDSSSEASISRSLKSSEIGVVGVDDDRLHSQFEGLDHQKHTDCLELSPKSTEPEEFVEDSREGNCMHNDHVTNDSPSSFHNTGNCNKLGSSIDEMSTAENFLRGAQKPVIDLTSDEHTAERTKHTSDGI
ncbi:PREDICTED: probable ubiquitin-like-specific protease 2B isoform X7 [Populus euphratica]|uniref:Probable ubiquitin-like-specific protease 2B isoform X7 n=1 Tax=Populus euphratica TaxID=75702 RepID=A0AAJ6Y5A9_POPEU|nr:PREDICTED: probable ubiquitin-like-specific protease 2B isoform X7 [Populus euphratica]